jgi:iron complex transport system permease protein
MHKHKFAITILLLLIAGLSAAFISLHLGTIAIPWSTIPACLFPESIVNPADQQMHLTVLSQIRFPRVITVLLCGAALSVSGAAYQSMFMNPLVSPGLLGVLAGAAFGASAGMLFGKSFFVSQLFAFVFGISAVSLSVFLVRFFPGNRLIMLIMGGVISSSLFTSLLSVIKYVADTRNELPAIVYWLMGGFSSVSLPAFYLGAPALLAGTVLLLMFSGYLNALSMGDEEAATLGINVEKIRLILIITTTLVCSITVAMGGMVGWVGLMIPHIARMLAGPDNRQMMPIAAIIGGLYLLMVDNVCRLAFTSEIPIGIMTSLMGVPFFILILSRTESRWN